MKLSLREDGGFALPAGGRRHVEVDTDATDAATAAELHRLVGVLRGDAPPARPGRGADRRTYVLGIDEAGEVATFVFTDPVVSPAASALIELLGAQRTSPTV